MPRAKTHLPLETIAGWEVEYPELKSFILGYRVHCLLDQIDVKRVIGRAFPFFLIEPVKRISGQQMTMLAELHFIRTRNGSQIPLSITGAYNSILRDLGISTEMCAAMANGLRQYFANPAFDTAVNAFSRIGMVDNSRVERYIRAAESLQKNRLLTDLLLWGVKNARLEQAADETVK